MFFMHYLHYLKKQYSHDPDMLLKLPHVTCFEKDSSWGGVWRDSDSTVDDRNILHNLDTLVDELSDSSSSSSSSLSSSCSNDNDSECSLESDSESEYEINDSMISNDIHPTSMYTSLWMNASKELIEFHDYTYQEHFSQSLPLFLNRRQVLDYITTRVTRNNPDFWKFVRFDTEVEFVHYDQELKKFQVTVKDTNGTKETFYFDKCIWASGLNGRQIIPKRIHNLLVSEGYQGVILHSADIGNYLDNIRDKTVVLIGDSYSAEDLCLKAIKVGVEKVIIYSRSSNGVCCETGSWPYNKVMVITNYMPYQVVNKTGILWKECDYNMKMYCKEVIMGGKEFVSEHVDAIIYCTGYHPNAFMLENELKIPEDDGPKYKWIAKNFVMSENQFTSEVGNIQPSPYLNLEFVNLHPYVYKGVLLSNPNMMFLQEEEFDAPLLEIDLNAWTLLQIMIQNMPIPSEQELEEEQKNIIVSAMNVPDIRYLMDRNYYIQHHVTFDKHHWSNLYLHPKYIQMTREYMTWTMQYLAQDMKACGYPVQIGDWNGLNEKGMLYLELMIADNLSRPDLGRTMEDKNEHEEWNQPWRTFRDRTDVKKMKSVFTGVSAVEFKKPWLKVED